MPRGNFFWSIQLVKIGFALPFTLRKINTRRQLNFYIPINSRASIAGYSFISCSTTLIAGSDLFSMQNKISY